MWKSLGLLERAGVVAVGFSLAVFAVTAATKTDGTPAGPAPAPARTSPPPIVRASSLAPPAASAESAGEETALPIGQQQAALKAKRYLDMGGFSRKRLIHQLNFEGFTKEQAEFGANAVGY